MDIVSNPETGDVTVRVVTPDGTKDYRLKLSINASIQLQQRRKKAYGLIVNDFATHDTESMRDVLFVLLQVHHKDEFKTLDQAGDLLSQMGPNQFFLAFKELSKVGAPEAEDKPNPQRPAPSETSTGDGSSSSAAG
jgi:hypothetical protein